VFKPAPGKMPTIHLAIPPVEQFATIELQGSTGWQLANNAVQLLDEKIDALALDFPALSNDALIEALRPLASSARWKECSPTKLKAYMYIPTILGVAIMSSPLWLEPNLPDFAPTRLDPEAVALAFAMLKAGGAITGIGVVFGGFGLGMQNSNSLERAVCVDVTVGGEPCLRIMREPTKPDHFRTSVQILATHASATALKKLWKRKATVELVETLQNAE